MVRLLNPLSHLSFSSRVSFVSNRRRRFSFESKQDYIYIITLTRYVSID